MRQTATRSLFALRRTAIQRNTAGRLWAETSLVMSSTDDAGRHQPLDLQSTAVDRPRISVR